MEGGGAGGGKGEGGAAAGGGGPDPDAELFDMALVQQLESLGFVRLTCKKALFHTGGAGDVQDEPEARAAIVERAMMWCFEHMEDADIGEEMDFSSAAGAAQADDPYDGYFDPSLVQVLQEMGFGASRAHRGLFYTGNTSVEAAMEWIIAHALDEDIDVPLDPEEVTGGPPDPAQELVRAMRAPLDIMLEQQLMHLCEMILRAQDRHVFGPEGDMNVAEGLVSVLGLPMEQTMSCPDAPLCACRAVKAFAEMSDDVRGFFCASENLAVLLGCLGRGDALLTEEAISAIDMIVGGRGALPRSLIEQGALETVLATLTGPASGPRYAAKALALARRLCSQMRGSSLSDGCLQTLVTLAASKDSVVSLGAVRCLERLLSYRGGDDSHETPEFASRLLQAEGGSLARLLVGKLQLPQRPSNDDVGIFASTCELLSTLCAASQNAAQRLVALGLLDSVVSAVSRGSEIASTWSLVQTVLLTLFDGRSTERSDAEAAAENALENGDAVEIFSRAGHRPLGTQQYSNGVILRSQGDGTYHVEVFDGPNDGEPVGRNRLRKWLQPLEQPAASDESVEELHCARNTFSLELLPTLLAKCQKSVHRPLLTTLLLFLDRLATSCAADVHSVWTSASTGEPAKLSPELTAHIARIAQSLLGMDAWSAHIQGLRLVNSLLVFLPASVVQFERHGVLERVQDLFSSAWAPTGEGDGSAQISQQDAQKKAVASTANSCLEAARAARAGLADADEFAPRRAALQALRSRIEAGEEAALAEVVTMVCARDGVTLHEFQEAEFAEAFLRFVSPTLDDVVDPRRMAALSRVLTAVRGADGGSSPRMAGKPGAERVVDLLHGLLRIGDRLPLFLHGPSGPSGLGTLLKPVRVKFLRDRGNLSTQLDDREVAVQPLTSLAELQSHILGAARCTDQRYISYCEELVGCRIRQRLASRWSYANVMSFHAEDGEHTIIHECGTATRQVMASVEFTCVRGRTPRSAAAAASAFRVARQAALQSKQAQQDRQAQDAAAAKARAEARRQREESRLRAAEGLEQPTSRNRARIDLEEDEDGYWHLGIRLQSTSQPRERPTRPNTAPRLTLSSNGGVSVAARWAAISASSEDMPVDRVRLKLRSRGTKAWSVYDPESRCVVHGGHPEQEDLEVSCTEAMVLALAPSTMYEGCLAVRCRDTGEWSDHGATTTVYTDDAVIADPFAIWEWEHGPGEFVEYDMDSTSRLEELYNSRGSREGTHDITISGRESRYKVDLLRMIQTNENSGASRRLRRISDEVALRTASLATSERVCARASDGRWVPGVISSVNADGACDVELDTGEDRRGAGREELISLTRCAEHAARRSPSGRPGRARRAGLSHTWSALDVTNQQASHGVVRLAQGADAPSEDSLADSESQCDSNPPPCRPVLAVKCSFDGFCFADDESGQTSPQAQPIRDELTAFEAIGRASGLVSEGSSDDNLTGLWLVRGCFSKYLVMHHGADGSLLGGWLESRGGNLTRRTVGDVADGKVKLHYSDYTFTATIAGDEMTGSWKQQSAVGRKTKEKATAKAKGKGMEKGFFEKAVEEFHPAHVHAIEKSDRTTAWRCDVCSERNPSASGRRYRCAAGCDFDVCGACRDAGRKGKGRFRATRQPDRGRGQASLMWEAPFVLRYSITVDSTATQRVATADNTMWCLHDDCLQVTEPFADRASRDAHMLAAHGTTALAAERRWGATGALGSCKPCFVPALSMLRILQSDQRIAGVIKAGAWHNLGLSHQLARQLGDSLAVASGVLPRWCAYLLTHARQLFSLEQRQQFFLATSFGTSRAVSWFQTHHAEESEGLVSQRGSGLAGGRIAARGPGGPMPTLGTLQVSLVHIPRHDFLNHALRLLDTHAKDRRELRVEFEDEPGTGKGVWPEFFTKSATELQRRRLLPSGESSAEQLPALWVEEFGGDQFVDILLFPRPVTVEGKEAVVPWFRFLGRLLGRAMLDSNRQCVRIVPLPLHPMFFELLCEPPGQSESRPQPQRWAMLQRLAKEERWPGHSLVCGAVQAALDSERMPGLGDQTTSYSQGMPVGEWLAAACFEDPVTGAALRPRGLDTELSLANLSEFLDLLWAAWLGSGIAAQVEACRAGFADVAVGVAPGRLHDALRVFEPAELQVIVCGEVGVEWSMADLRQMIKPGYEYTESHDAFVWLLEELLAMDQPTRSAFLSFVTSSPRLPQGGLTIVVDKQRADSEADAVALPTARTCTQQLRLPPYGSRAELAKMLGTALAHGEEGFGMQ